MAFVRCACCGTFVSEQATACPRCGHPVELSKNAQSQNDPDAQQQNAGQQQSNGQQQWQNAGGPQWQNPYQHAWQAQGFPPPYVDPSGKNRTTAGVLALLLGCFGIHYFYLDKPVPGIVFLVLFCTIVPSILAFAQGIVMLTMTDEQFYQKYVYTNDSFPLF